MEWLEYCLQVVYTLRKFNCELLQTVLDTIFTWIQDSSEFKMTPLK